MTDFLAWWADHWPLIPAIVLFALVVYTLARYYFMPYIARVLIAKAIFDAFEEAGCELTHINGKPVKRRREP